MRAVLQRVTKASVAINNKVYSEIKKGLLIFVAFEQQDNKDDFEWMINKIINLRIFNDSEGKMNIALKDINGEVLIVSQFTLYALTKKGNRPSYIRSAPPITAEKLYESFVDLFKSKHDKVFTGEFGADMKVELVNDGPVTIIMDSKNKAI